MTCKPCRVTYEGQRYQVERDGTVRPVVFAGGMIDREATAATLPLDPNVAQAVRREAARQRRNRAGRERSQAMRDLGLVRAPGGAFGGWE